MSIHHSNIAGLLLAGGRSSRFAGNDKGFQLWQQRPLVEHALQRLDGQVASVTISCNSNWDQYHEVALKYCSHEGQQAPLCMQDSVLPANSGPLAGIFTLLDWLTRQTLYTGRQNASQTTHLMVCCCDNPTLPVDIVARLAQCLFENKACAAYPVVNGSHARLTLLLRLDTATEAMRQILAQPIATDGLSVKRWLAMLTTTTLELNDDNAGCNINSPSDLAELNQAES